MLDQKLERGRGGKVTTITAYVRSKLDPEVILCSILVNETTVVTEPDKQRRALY